MILPAMGWCKAWILLHLSTSCEGNSVRRLNVLDSLGLNREEYSPMLTITNPDGSHELVDASPYADGSITAELPDGSIVIESADGAAVTFTAVDGTVMSLRMVDEHSSKTVVAKPDGSRTASTTHEGSVFASTTADGTGISLSYDGRTIELTSAAGTTVIQVHVPTESMVEITAAEDNADEEPTSTPPPSDFGKRFGLTVGWLIPLCGGFLLMFLYLNSKPSKTAQERTPKPASPQPQTIDAAQAPPWKSSKSNRPPPSATVHQTASSPATMLVRSPGLPNEAQLIPAVPRRAPGRLAKSIQARQVSQAAMTDTICI
jgi:hypothetical protein